MVIFQRAVLVSIPLSSDLNQILFQVRPPPLQPAHKSLSAFLTEGVALTSLLSVTGTHLNIRRDVSPTVTHFFSLPPSRSYETGYNQQSKQTLPPSQLRKS